MKLKISYFYCITLFLFWVSVAQAQNEWNTVYMVNGQTIQIDGNQYPYGTVWDDGGAIGTCSSNFNGYAIISADSGMVIHLSGHYSFRNHNGWITIWDGDTNGIPLSWRLSGIGTLNITARSGMLAIGFQTDTGSLEHCGFRFNYAVTSPDTCASVIDLAVEDACADCEPMRYKLYWWYYWQPDYWEIEYGPHGFELGSGTVVEQNGNGFSITELEFRGLLQPNTEYDFYVRSVCEGGMYGDWASVSYHTYCAKVDSITAWGGDDVTVTFNGLLAGYKATWRDTTDTRRWYVDYYRTGSNPYWWEMPCKSAVVDTPVYCFPPLAPNTQYTFVVQSDCDGSRGISQWIYFTTADVGIAVADVSELTVSPNPANGRCVVSLPDNMSAELKLYDSDGRLMQTLAYNGTPIELLLPSHGVFLLQATTAVGIVIRKIVNQ